MLPAHTSRFISITHGEDLDGLAAQALILRHFKEQVLPETQTLQIELFQENYASVKATLHSLSAEGLQNATLIVSDLGYSPDFQNWFEQLTKPQRNNKIIYFDHHGGTRRGESWLTGRGVECHLGKDEMCTARVIQELYFSEESHAECLAKEACESDNVDPNRSENNQFLSRTIGTLSTVDIHDDRLAKIVEILAMPRFYEDLWLQAQIREGQARYQAELDQIEHRLKRAKAGTWSIAWSWSPLISSGVITSRIFDTFCREDAPDIAIGVNDGGRVSFKTESGIDVEKIANLFGGGGHTNRAGFNLGRQFADLEGFLKEVIEHVAHYNKELL